MREKDFTPTGLKLEGNYENDRNQDFNQLYRDILTEVFAKEGQRFDVIIGHHLCYSIEDVRPEGTFFIVEEIPSADALIFDHGVMSKLFPDTYLNVMSELAVIPTDGRDEKLSEFYYGRKSVVETVPTIMVNGLGMTG